MLLGGGFSPLLENDRLRYTHGSCPTIQPHTRQGSRGELPLVVMGTDADGMNELDAYDFELPRDLVAQHPLPHRTDARLLVVDRAKQSIDHHHIRDLPGLLRYGDHLVMNDTRVIPARLVGRREQTGARWSGLFLSADDQGNWQVLGKTRGKLLPGEAILVLSWDLRQSIKLRLLTKLEGGVWVVRPEPLGDPWELLDSVGRVPLPPYIRDGEMIEADSTNYQTVFAKTRGAVAAPTAGLHFTPELLEKVKVAGVLSSHVTLHVGLGTFRPVTAEKLAEHVMHSEFCDVSQPAVEAILKTKSRGGRVIAVGTTVARSLESAAAPTGKLEPFSGPTNLFIRPPFTFRVLDGLLTNFHLPRSTLLVLVRTFGGDELIQQAYREAIEERYRFYSYGDAMLIL